jgi:hypothetical protein
VRHFIGKKRRRKNILTPSPVCCCQESFLRVAQWSDLLKKENGRNWRKIVCFYNKLNIFTAFLIHFRLQ